MQLLRGLPRFLPLLTLAAALAAAPGVPSTAPTPNDDPAINPPPITLHLNAQEPEQASLSLAEATGSRLRFITNEAGWQPTLSIDANKLPFWDVYSRLSVQRPIDGLGGYGGGPGVLRDFERYGGFIFYLSSLSISRSLNIQAAAPAATDATVTFHLGMAADPRIKVLQEVAFVVESVTDDAGTQLMEKNAPKVGEPSNGYTTDHSWATSGGFKLSAVHGKNLTFKAVGTFFIQLSQAKGELDDIEKHVGEKFKAGTREFQVTRFKLTPPPPGAIGFEGPIGAILDFAIDASPAEGPLAYTEFSITDSTGELAFQTSNFTGRLEKNLQGHFKGPFTVVVRIPEKIKTVTIPMQLKNVPLQ